MSDAIYMPDPHPFWFVTSELLMEVLRAEIRVVARFLEEHPELPGWFDDPEIEIEQRKICFAVAARNKVTFNMSETIADRREPYSPLAEKETDTIERIRDLIASDAPSWASEMERVIERMPSHLYAALPQSLGTRRIDESSEQTKALKALSTLEQIQAFIQAVLDQQLVRLETRWHLAVQSEKQTRSRRKNKRTGWEQREKLYTFIQKILRDDPTLQGLKFCAALDKRHAPPLYDWVKRGEWREGLTWKEAWSNQELRRKIRRVRQEAQKRR